MNRPVRNGIEISEQRIGRDVKGRASSLHIVTVCVPQLLAETEEDQENPHLGHLVSGQRFETGTSCP
jgi:hypothetical protein